MTLPLILAVLIFVTIALAAFAFGAAAYAPSSILGARLRSLAFQRPQAQQQEKPAIERAPGTGSRSAEQSIAAIAQRYRPHAGWLIQAGYRESKHMTIYSGLRVSWPLVGFGC